MYAARTLSHADPYSAERRFDSLSSPAVGLACTARETHFIPVERRKSSHCRTGEKKGVNGGDDDGRWEVRLLQCVMVGGGCVGEAQGRKGVFGEG